MALSLACVTDRKIRKRSHCDVNQGQGTGIVCQEIQVHILSDAILIKANKCKVKSHG
jgi:hypothetical protein